MSWLRIMVLGFCFTLLCGMGAEEGYAQVPDSCLILWQYSPLKPHNVVWTNDDSMMVDMCSGPEYLAEYAKKLFSAAFYFYIIPDSLAPVFDTLEREWGDIDAKYSDIKESFKFIEQRFGHFKLKHIGGGIIGDTVAWGKKAWYINFDQYTNVDSVLFYLSQIPEISPLRATFLGRPRFYQDVKGLQTISHIDIWPQPVEHELFIQGVENPGTISLYDVLGRQLTLKFNLNSEKLQSLDVSMLSEGVYYCYISAQCFKILIRK